MNISDKFIVVDDFYKDPMRVRDFAKSLQYRDISKENYPGYQSFNNYISNGLVKKLEGIIGSEIDVEKSKELMGYFRWIPHGKQSRLKVHTDCMDWTVVIYLTPNGARDAGTQFYKHKRTGLYGPPDEEFSKKMGYENFTDYENKVVEPDTLDDSCWEVVHTIDYKFNRCVIFKAAELFHSHSSTFGECIETARMTQNFFFDVKK